MLQAEESDVSAVPAHHGGHREDLVRDRQLGFVEARWGDKAHLWIALLAAGGAFLCDAARTEPLLHLVRIELHGLES
jgi:hypothetical protein